MWGIPAVPFALILALAALLLHNVAAAALVSHAAVQQPGEQSVRRAAEPSLYLPITARGAPLPPALAAPPGKFGIGPLHPIAKERPSLPRALAQQRVCFRLYPTSYCIARSIVWLDRGL